MQVFHISTTNETYKVGVILLSLVDGLSCHGDDQVRQTFLFQQFYYLCKKM